MPSGDLMPTLTRPPFLSLGLSRLGRVITLSTTLLPTFTTMRAMMVPRWTSSTTPGSLLRADIGIQPLSQKLLAVVGGVDLGELHLVFGQFVRGEDGSGFADGGTGPTIQTPLRVDEELP